MSRNSLKLYSVSLILVLCLGYSCKDKEKDTPKSEFDRKAMLENVGNNIIIPAYQAFQVEVNKLDAAITSFNQSPDSIGLLNLQGTFKNTYRVWQSCSAFGFGPAEQEYLSLNVNTFPSSTAKINSGIASGTYNLNSISNMDMKGLPGMDYLLFGTDNKSTLTLFTSDGKAANRKQYLATLSSDLKTKTATVLNAWLPNGGNYIGTFINSTGTDIGSSLGLLTNQFDYDLEVLKNYKLGIPLGKQSGGTIYPEKVEAYYSAISSELALIQLKAIENVYLGKSSAGDGSGFDDYLVHLDAKYNGGSLNDAIKGQFSVCMGKLQLLPEPLSAGILTNIEMVNAAYKEVQKLVVLLKTDMPSSMGVLITYVDNDGD